VDDCAAFDAEKLERRLDRRTRSEATEGNAAALLVDGAEAWARRYENTKDADLVLVKTFIFTDDEAGRAAATLLRARARAGATVVVQYDFKGSVDGAEEAGALYRTDRERLFADTPLLASLARDGVIVVPTNVPRTAAGAKRLLRSQAEISAAEAEGRPPELRLGTALVHFDHEKYWITAKKVDGRVELRAILGGMNIASEYAYGGTAQIDDGTGRGGWRDTDVEVRGPVTTAIVRRFFDVMAANVTTWPEGLDRAVWEAPQEPVGAASVRFVWNQPSWGTRSRIVWLYRELVKATPDDGIVRLQSAYFTPGPRVRRPLVRHLKDGGRLAVLTNSPESTDMGIVATASRGAYHHLLDASPRAALFEWRPTPGRTTLHSKVASFGTCGPVVIGSANLDGLSSLHNSESVVLIDDPTLRAEFDAMFAADLAASTRLDPTAFSDAPVLERWSRLGVYWLGWRFLGE
jgi:phosphatidylserine/phosphatidylglycerophosphate/cardiolipin synthase-like enzyme